MRKDGETPGVALASRGINFSPTQPEVADHRIAGEVILSAAVMLVSAMDEVTKERELPSPTRLRDCRLMTRVPLVGSSQVTLQIEAANFRLLRHKTEFCRGKFDCSKGDLSANSASPCFSALEVESRPAISRDSVYRDLSLVGYHYGSHYRTIEQAAATETVLEATLALRQRRAVGTVDVGLLDGVFQAILVAARHWEIWAGTRDSLLLPVAIRCLTITAPLVGECGVRVRKEDIRVVDGSIFSSAEVFTPEGAPLVSVEGLLWKVCPPWASRLDGPPHESARTGRNPAADR